MVRYHPNALANAVAASYNQQNGGVFNPNGPPAGPPPTGAGAAGAGGNDAALQERRCRSCAAFSSTMQSSDIRPH